MKNVDSVYRPANLCLDKTRCTPAHSEKSLLSSPSTFPAPIIAYYGHHWTQMEKALSMSAGQSWCLSLLPQSLLPLREFASCTRPDERKSEAHSLSSDTLTRQTHAPLKITLLCCDMSPSHVFSAQCWASWRLTLPLGMEAIWRGWNGRCLTLHTRECSSHWSKAPLPWMPDPCLSPVSNCAC